MKSYGTNLSKVLRKCRDGLGETQEKFAKRTGYSRATINRWEGEDGAGTATIEDVERLSHVLQIPFQEMLGFEPPSGHGLDECARRVYEHFQRPRSPLEEKVSDLDKASADLAASKSPQTPKKPSQGR